MSFQERALDASMDYLVSDLQMLTGLTVVYGNARESDSVTVGNGQEVLARGEGFLDVTKPLTASSLYDLASLTKLFTLVAVMQLVEGGQLSLDDRVDERDDRFPGLHGAKLYEVLSYQAVLRSPERIDEQPDKEAALKQVFSIYRAEGPEPQKLYSDMNALLLKYVIERVTDLSYYDYLKERVFDRCGMRETYTQVPRERWGDCLNYNYEHRLMGGRAILIRDAAPGQPHDPKARLLCDQGSDLPGHAGLFSTAGDMALFAKGLLSGELLSMETLREIGVNRTGRLGQDGSYRQYLGYLCFSKSAVQRLSELPSWMGERAFGLSGYTGNHIAIDPDLGVFDIFLGNRCHNRVSVIDPPEDALPYGLSPEGAGLVPWPDGRQVKSSYQYQYQKDRLLHQPVYRELKRRGWLRADQQEEKHAEGTVYEPGV